MSLHKAARTMIIAGSVILVCVLAMVLLIKFVPEKEDPEATATATPEPETIYILNEDADALTKVETVLSSGESLSVVFGVDDEGNLTYDVTPPARYYSYNLAKFRTVRSIVNSVTAKKIIATDAEDLSVYGLDKPKSTTTLTFEGGRQIKIYVGNTTPVGSDYFCSTSESNTVYTIGGTMAALLSRTEMDYRNVATFPSYTDNAQYEQIEWIRLTKTDGSVVELQRDAGNPSEGNIANSYYFMTEPIKSSCADDYVAEQVVDIVSQIQYVSIDKDITRDELREYGLDKPSRLQMRDLEGNEIDIMIGKGGIGTGSANSYCADTDQYYACLEDNEPLTLLIYTSAAFNWQSLNYLDLINRAVWLQDIDTVASIDYTMQGTTYHVEYEQTPALNANDVEYLVITGTISNGTDTHEFNETNARRLYQRTLNFRASGDIPADAKIGAAEYVITLNLLDGKKRRLELVQLNEKQYAAVVDGVAEHYIFVDNIGNLTEAFEKLMDDRNIPLIYYN